ncbi:MAG: hypothetical protein ACT6FG_00470 [Methanosarcinaceae archaeon]
MMVKLATIHKRISTGGHLIKIGDVVVGIGISKADCQPLTDELNKSDEKREFVLDLVSGLPDIEL